MKNLLKKYFPKQVQIYRLVIDKFVFELSPLLIGRSIFFMRDLDEKGFTGDVQVQSEFYIKVIQSIEELDLSIRDDPFWISYFQDKNIKKRFVEHNLFFAAFHDEKLVGIRWCATGANVTLTPPLPTGFDFDTIPYMYGILTHPDFRRKGVATALQRYSTDYLFRKGITQISIMVWDRNKAAIKLAEQGGFVACGTILNVRLFHRDYFFHQGTYFKDHVKNKKR